MKNKKIVLVLLSIIVFSSLWLLSSGMPYAHDIHFHYDRVIGLSRTIKNGDFLALIHDHFYGYGYATGLFYGNFYLYIPALLEIIGLPNMVAYKIMYVFINIITTFSIYYVLKSITKDKKISVIGTIIYMFSNYRIVDVFVRGALGEMLAFMIIPFVILGLYEIVYRDYKKWYIFSISFVLLLLAHLISTLLIAFFVLVFILCNYKKFIEDKNRIKYLMISGIVGLLLGSFFLLPIIEQKLYGNISIFKESSMFLPQDQVVSIKHFLIPTNFFNTHIGIVLMLLLPIRFFIKKDKIKEKDLLKLADTFYVLGIIAWVFTTKIFPWSVVGNSLSFIQFPWRLLIVTTPFLVFSYCVYFKYLDDKKLLKGIYWFAVIVSVSEMLLYSVQYGYRKIQHHKFPKNEIGTGEYLIYNTKVDDFDKIKHDVVTNNSNMKIDYNKKGTKVIIKYSNNNKSNTYIEIPVFNYYGYKASGAKLENGKNNVIRLNINDTEGAIKVSYKGTNIQKVSYVVSCITLLGLVVYIIKEKRNENGIS